MERAQCVLQFLKKQSWVDVKHISVFGHSQGSYIATKLARITPEIKAVGYSSGNPDGRFTLFIRQWRRSVQSKQATPQQAQDGINEFYEAWKSYCKGIVPEGMEKSDPAHTWTSFTLSLREDLVTMRTPVFIAYGTEDLESTESSELMPIYFEQAGKTNYKMFPVVGCGHNFEEYKVDGSPDYDKMHWDDVMKNFVSWMEQLK